MKKQLLKIFYACLPAGMTFMPIVIGMFSIATANAQIVYTDIISDTILTNPGNYDLDLNNDGQIDFTFYGHEYSICLSCSGLIDSSTISPTSLSWVSDTIIGQSAKLNSGDLINASSPLWTNAPSQTLYIKRGHCVQNFLCPRIRIAFQGDPYSGIWSSVADKYLALKIQVSGSIYYGWARLDVGSFGSPITIKDYAYNSIPDSAILAGQTNTGITEITENFSSSSIALYPNPTTNQLTIALGSNNKKVGVTITDITGKIIYTTTARETQKIEVNTKDYSAGVYVVQIQTADFIETKKLIVEK